MATSSGGFSDAEKAAMKERAAEIKASKATGSAKKAREYEACLEKIAEMPAAERVIAERLHAIVAEVAPDLSPKTMYGMPAYANADGKVVVFFQAGGKFETRYCTIGFNDVAALDDGSMWPTSWAVTDLTPATEKAVAELVEKSIG